MLLDPLRREELTKTVRSSTTGQWCREGSVVEDVGLQQQQLICIQEHQEDRVCRCAASASRWNAKITKFWPSASQKQ